MDVTDWVPLGNVAVAVMKKLRSSWISVLLRMLTLIVAVMLNDGSLAVKMSNSEPSLADQTTVPVDETSGYQFVPWLLETSVGATFGVARLQL